MAKKASETIYYVVVIVAVFNCIAFMVEGSWTPLLFFLLATFATFSVKPDKTLALVTGIVVSNLYRATAGVHEGMTTEKSTRDLEDSNDGLDDVAMSSIKAPTKPPSKAKVPKPTAAKPIAKSNQDLEIDNLLGGSGGSLEGLMARQSKLMKNLKDMQPMMAQAKNMLNSLPKGFVKKALEQFKQQ